MIYLQDDAPELAQYGSFLQISCDTIRANLTALQERISCRVMAVLKNNGYGLSLPGYARLLSQLGVASFAVGTVEEALRLRQDGIEGDVLLLTPQTAQPVLKALIEKNIQLTIGSPAQARAALAAGEAEGARPRAHVMIDTGLGRYGFTPHEACAAAGTLRELDVVGTYTHFSSPYGNARLTARQYAAFLRAADDLNALRVETGLLHCCASGAALRYPMMHLDMVRLGSALLGRVPEARRHGLRPAVALVAPIAAVREVPAGRRLGYNGSVRLGDRRTVGIVDAGPASGYLPQRRCLGLLPVRQFAEVGGQRARILGCVGINSLAVDLTGIDCQEADTVKLAVNPLHCTADLPRLFVRGGETVACAADAPAPAVSPAASPF